MEPTTFSALVAMEKLGYIERRRLPHSKKNMYVFLTDAGRTLENKLVPLAEEVNRIMIGKLAGEDVITTRRVLLAIIENLAADEFAKVEDKSKGESNADASSADKPAK